MMDRPAIPLTGLRPLSPDERRRSLEKALADAPAGEPLRVFAYGSLIWSPCFAFDEATTATLRGYRRAFNFWTIQTRGTPDTPGLGLGLEPGGQCEGVLYRIAESARDEAIAAIWAREMFSAVYQARWLPVHAADAPRQALCFVTNPKHEQYAGSLDRATAARIIARACGTKGRCRDYLAEAVRALAGRGVSDPFLDDLLALVDGQATSPSGSGAPRP